MNRPQYQPTIYAKETRYNVNYITNRSFYYGYKF